MDGLRFLTGVDAVSAEFEINDPSRVSSKPGSFEEATAVIIRTTCTAYNTCVYAVYSSIRESRGEHSASNKARV